MTFYKWWQRLLISSYRKNMDEKKGKLMKKDHLLIFSFVLAFLLSIIFNAYLPFVAKVFNFVTFWMLIAVIVYRVLINRRKR